VFFKKVPFFFFLFVVFIILKTKLYEFAGLY
jgi:hypothetical protein